MIFVRRLSASLVWPAFVALGPLALSLTAGPTQARSARGSSSKANAASQQAPPLKSVQAFLAKFCAPCHSGASAPGGLLLGNLKSEKDMIARRLDFDKVAERIIKKSMPPQGAKQPTQKERDAFIKAVQAVFSKAPPPPPDPGRPTLRRLNRAEYNNTVRDLFGVDFSPADDFPSDDVGYGFDNIGDVLSISPLLMEKYLDAAEKITDKVLPPPKGKTLNFDAARLQTDNGIQNDSALGFFTNGRAWTEPNLEAGSYRVRVLAFGQQAGPEPCKMELRVDGKFQSVFEVRATDRAQPYDIPPVELAAGKHRIAVAFINDYYNPNDPDPRNRDRNLYVVAIEVSGPIGAEGIDSFARRQLMIVTPDPSDPLPAANTILSGFLRKAFRRPVPQKELDRYVTLVSDTLREKRPFEDGIKLAVQAALISPSFLFRVELDPPTAPKPGKPIVRVLNDFEIASRLSYFLWSSMPDEALFALAETGRLREPQVLQQQLARMLKDPKAKALTDNFADQWLNLRKLDAATPDSDLFPDWSDTLRQDMKAETHAFFGSVVREDRSVIEFLNAPYTFVNERLARFYGMPGISGSEFRKVALTDGKRGGILTQAALLTLTSNPNRTSPVKRGKWVLENLLGEPPPPPPPGIAPLPGDKDKVPTMTVKERLRLHRQNPDCAVCHVKMDAIGFGLENFDAVGKWRTKDGPFPVDSSENMGDGTLIAGPEGLRGYLMKRKDDFVRTLADRLLTYALGRGMEPSDKPAIDRIVAQAAKGGYRFSAVVSAVAASDPFLKRRVN